MGGGGKSPHTGWGSEPLKHPSDPKKFRHGGGGTVFEIPGGGPGPPLMRLLGGGATQAPDWPTEISCTKKTGRFYFCFPEKNLARCWPKGGKKKKKPRNGVGGNLRGVGGEFFGPPPVWCGTGGGRGVLGGAFPGGGGGGPAHFCPTTHKNPAERQGQQGGGNVGPKLGDALFGGLGGGPGGGR